MSDTILLIDDETAHRRAIKRLLSDGNRRFVEAGNGRQALNILESMQVDLVLLDLVMPDMDGYAFLEHYRSNVTNATIPVCVMTAWSDNANRRQAIDLGADDFIGKPVDHVELETRVKSLLRIREYQKHLADFNARLETRVAERAAELVSANTELAETVRQLQQVRRQQEVWSEAQIWINDARGLLADGRKTKVFYQQAVHHAMVLTRTRSGAYGVFDDEGVIKEFITLGIHNDVLQQASSCCSQNKLLSKVLNEDKPIRINDPFENRGRAFPIINDLAKGKLLVMPLHLHGILRGVFFLADKDNGESLTDQDSSTLYMYALRVLRILERHDLDDALRKTNEALQMEKEEQVKLIKKLQNAHEQLLQSEKLASIGQLAAGVAHEINNPVGYINSNLGTLQNNIGDIFGIVDAYEELESRVDQQDELLAEIRRKREEIELDYVRKDVLDIVSECREGVGRVKQIVQDLKDFSHVDEAEWQWADLHKGLDSTLNIVRSEIKYRAKVVKEYGELPQVECLASQLNQVFMNLLVNAAHAMEERGVITVRTGTRDSDWAWVEISDNGMGIAPEQIKRIFDPFFTTKPVGKGTGLGLSLSYGIVNKHGGRIEVESEAGNGATFRVWLPVRQDLRAASSEQRAESRKVASR